jgi:multiple sugar transport system permease protein
VISLAAKTASIKEPKRSSALVRQETIASYLFLLPSLIFFLGFVIYPMILCVVTSFFDSTMNRADVFVGFANYAELFADPIFIGALRNTFIIVVVSVPVTCAFSLWVSSAIVDLPEWATSLFRCVFYLPVVTGCHRRVEVDVQQLLRHLQLSGQGCGPHRQEHQLAGR